MQSSGLTLLPNKVNFMMDLLYGLFCIASLKVKLSLGLLITHMLNQRGVNKPAKP
jgi:hypothetical protein